MKISAFLDNLSQNIEDQFEYAKRLNLECISLRGMGDKKPYDLNEKDIDKIAELQRNSKVKIIEIAASLEKYECFDDAAHSLALSRLIKVANLANKLGVLNISMRLPSFKLVTVQEHNQIKARINDYVKIIEKAKRRLCLLRSKVDTGASFSVIAKEIKSKFVGVIFEPETIYRCKDSVSTSYRVLKDRIFSVRVSDCDELLNPQLIGYGKAELLDVFKKLKTDNFDGYLTFDNDFSSILNKKTIKKEKRSIKRLFINSKSQGFDMELFKKRMGVNENDEISNFMIVDQQIQLLKQIFKD